jgi:C4-dicarboxylate-specific signal transduction histidine kinase
VRPQVGNGLAHGHGEVGATQCMRRERRHNALARESEERWPEVRERLTYDVRMSMKRKQHGWVHEADRLSARGSQADAASHGLVQVGHVCETRESGLIDGARLAAR